MTVRESAEHKKSKL